MNKFLALALLLLFVLFVIAACRPTSAAGEVARSEKVLLKDLQINPDDLRAVVDGNSAFGFDLYHMVRSRDGNLFFSPFSISSALGMTYAGAKNSTEEQMQSVLRFPPHDNLHAAFNILAQDLNARPDQAGEQVKTPFELSISNALWGQKDYQFEQNFLDLLAENYAAGMRLVDFKLDAEGSRKTINQWVSSETKDRIKDLVPPGAIDTMTRLVLTNAIYFKAGWLMQFEESATKNEPFYLLDGSSKEIPTMHLNDRLGYTIGDQYRALRLPYESGGFSMFLVLPDAGHFQAVEDRFSPEMLGEIKDGLGYGAVNLALPKFSFDSEFNLNRPLIDLGMIDAFDSGLADFSGMTGKRDLYIGNVIHKAFIAVDEKGTEAAAATAVIMAETSAMEPEEPVDLIFDRPFLFVIQDDQTGSILFIGRLLDPATE